MVQVNVAAISLAVQTLFNINIFIKINLYEELDYHCLICRDDA